MPKVKVWVVEHDNRKDEIFALANGFQCVYENGENVVLVKI
jgi:hypothetical protein